MPIYGHFLPLAPGADKRHEARRKLSLLASGLKHDGTGLEVQIHNISGTGLLLESDIKLAAGDRIEIELPHAGDITAAVIWASGRLFGCQFEGPVSPATLSAVELKSAIAPAPAITPALSDDTDIAEPEIDVFSVRVQHLRAKAGLSQAEVAKRLGVGAPSVSSWENGRARPKRGRMAKLAAVLGVGISDLLDDAPPEAQGLQKLIDHSRERIASAVGVGVDKVRITVEF